LIICSYTGISRGTEGCFVGKEVSREGQAGTGGGLKGDQGTRRDRTKGFTRGKEERVDGKTKSVSCLKSDKVEEGRVGREGMTR